jgi:acyl-CoA thioesterase FadM
MDEKPAKPRLIAEGSTVMVFYDYKQQSSVAIPDIIKERFYSYEKYLAN